MLKEGTAGALIIYNTNLWYAWGVILLKMLKYGTAGALYCWKGKNKAYLGSYIIENAGIM